MGNFSNTFFSWLGMMQRTKLGFVFLRVAMSLDSCSLYSWPTVRNMPLRVLKAPGISDMPETLSRPTMRSTERCDKKKMRKETLAKKPVGFNFRIWIFNQVNSIQMHVTRSNEWLLSLHFLVVNTHQERVEAIQTTRTSETPHKHRVNEEGNRSRENDDGVESQKASEAWRDYTPLWRIKKKSMQWVEATGTASLSFWVDYVWRFN